MRALTNQIADIFSPNDNERNKYCVLLKEVIAVCFSASCGQ